MRAFLLLWTLLLPIQSAAEDAQEFSRQRDWYDFPSEGGLVFSIARDDGSSKLVILAGKTPETFILTLERVDCAAMSSTMIGMNGSVNRDRIRILAVEPETERDGRVAIICDPKRWVSRPDPFGG